MTKWQWIRFKYWYHPFGRAWKYSSIFPYPGYWMRLFAGDIHPVIWEQLRVIRHKSFKERMRCGFRALQGRNPEEMNPTGWWGI